VQAGVGYELVLPGVHSNIGGSYGEVTDEEERHLHDVERRQLIEQGWYREEEITRTPHPVYDPNTGQLLYTTYSAVGKRLGLTWEYQFIPLAVMAQAAGKLMTLEPLSSGSRFEKYTLPSDHVLVPVQRAIEQEVSKHANEGAMPATAPGPGPAFAAGPGCTPLPLGFDLSARAQPLPAPLGQPRFQGLGARAALGMGERATPTPAYRLISR
jgi:hypothetical protein